MSSQKNSPLRPIITLLTDFGNEESYAGVMRGVILGIAPRARVVDLCHGIPPQDIVTGAFVLATSYRYFPPGTLHVVVVDPGVGSERALLALESEGQRFLGPDNGILGGVLQGQPPVRAVRLENRQYFLTPLSHVFHGRDILAPAAAHLARGLPLEELGPAFKEPLPLPWPQPRRGAGGALYGEMILGDHFGNCVSNIELAEGSRGRVELPGGKVVELCDHYAQVEPGEPLALRGSSGYLEVAVRNGSALQSLAMERGSPVVWHEERVE